MLTTRQFSHQRISDIHSFKIQGFAIAICIRTKETACDSRKMKRNLRVQGRLERRLEGQHLRETYYRYLQNGLQRRGDINYKSSKNFESRAELGLVCPTMPVRFGGGNVSSTKPSRSSSCSAVVVREAEGRLMAIDAESVG
jgi:hypothetical protein